MKKIIGSKTTTYEIKPDWYVDIVQHETGDIKFDCWLYHKDYGVKMYVCGDCRENKTSYDRFVEMVENYIYSPGINAKGSFFDFYKEEYMDE